jgi:hypothetical protein
VVVFVEHLGISAPSHSTLSKHRPWELYQLVFLKLLERCRSQITFGLHLLLDHDGYLPTFAVITDGKVSDIEIAR